MTESDTANAFHSFSKRKCLSALCPTTQQNGHYLLVFCCHVTGILHVDRLVNRVLEGCQLGLRGDIPHSTHKNTQDRLDKSCIALVAVHKAGQIRILVSNHCKQVPIVVNPKLHQLNKYGWRMVNSKSFIGKVFLRIKRKFELTYAL